MAYHPDRTYRGGADLEELIDVVERTGADVATVKAGDIDLTTATGRMSARIVAAVSRHESERMGERVSRAKKERAAEGRPAGGGRRPFGFLDDRITLHPTEAPMLAEIAARVATGQTSYNHEVAVLNDAGTTTTSGAQWTVASLRRACTSPRSAGLRDYKGTIVRDAVWPPIVDRTHWDTLVALGERRRRGGRPPSSPFLLRGLLECGRCGRRLYGTTRGSPAYRCVPQATTSGRGCGSCSISVARLDAHVLDAVRSWLTDEAVEATVAQPTGDHGRIVRAQVEVEQLEQRRAALTERFVDGRLTPVEYDTAMARTDQARTRLDALLAGTPEPVTGLEGTTLVELRARLDEDDVDARRQVIGALAATPIVVAPAARKGGVPEPVGGRVDLRPRWA